MVGVNIGDFFADAPWAPDKIDGALGGARCTGYFDCDAVKFWHCDPARVIPTASKDTIKKVMVNVNNDEMLTVNDWIGWVESNLAPVVRALRQCPVFKTIYLAVGNEPLAPWHVERFGKCLLPCLHHVVTALRATALYDRVKVVTPLEMCILSNSYPPSASTVADQHMEVVKGVVQFCVKHGSPFCVNVYPFFARQHASKEFVLFGPDPGYEDQGLKYTDMFSAQYDAVVRAVSKLGIPGADAMEVTVTETGWPTAESSMADSGSARKFTAGIVRASVHGTPLRPGRMDIYLFELFDERHKTGERHEKHFGLFDFEGNPKRG